MYNTRGYSESEIEIESRYGEGKERCVKGGMMEGEAKGREIEVRVQSTMEVREKKVMPEMGLVVVVVGWDAGYMLCDSTIQCSSPKQRQKGRKKGKREKLFGG